MMNWWLDRGVDGFRMDVINLLSKRVVPGVPGLSDGAAGGADDPTSFGNGWPHVVNGPRIHEFLQEMHQAVFARPAARTAHRRRDAGRVGRGRPALHRRRARRGRHGLPVRARRPRLRPAAAGGTSCRSRSSTSSGRMGRWQAGLAEVGWNSLYWGNHDQPRAVSRYGNDSPEHRVASAKALATVLHLHRGTPYVYQGDELGMTNSVFERVEDFRDLDSLNQYQAATGRGVDHDVVMSGLRRKSRDNARTPMQWDASEHAGFTTGTPWLARQPQPHRDQRRRPGRRPGLGVRPPPAADRAAPRRPGRRARRLHDAAARAPPALRLPADPRRRRGAGRRQPVRPARRRGRAARRRGLAGRRPGARQRSRRPGHVGPGPVGGAGAAAYPDRPE